MARPAPSEHVGVVVELLPSALYRVELESRHRIVAHVAGGLEKTVVRLVVGDRVRVTLSPADRTRGRITGKDER